MLNQISLPQLRCEAVGVIINTFNVELDFGYREVGEVAAVEGWQLVLKCFCESN